MSVRDSVRHVQGSAAGLEPVRGDSRAASGRGPGPSWTEGCSGISPGPGAHECRDAAIRLRPRAAPRPAPSSGERAAVPRGGAGPGRAEWGGGRCPGTARRGAARARPRSAAVRLPGRRRRRGGFPQQIQAAKRGDDAVFHCGARFTLQQLCSSGPRTNDRKSRVLSVPL